MDLRRLRRLHQGGAFFVVRERDDVRRYVTQSRPVDRSKPLRSDRTIRFCGEDFRKHWPEPMRRVSLFDIEHRRHPAFWSNQWELAACVIAELYRQRWQAELFFRWIKQNLRLRSFYGTSPNAVRVQLWTAIIAYLCAAITRHRCGLARFTNLTTFLHVNSLQDLSKVPVTELSGEVNTMSTNIYTQNQFTFSNL